MLPQM